MTRELTQEELRAALAAADRGLRLPWLGIVVTTAVIGLATGIALRFLDFRDPTHIVIVCAVAFVVAQLHFLAALVAARQNAANARMLRALELIDERVTRG